MNCYNLYIDLIFIFKFVKIFHFLDFLVNSDQCWLSPTVAWGRELAGREAP